MPTLVKIRLRLDEPAVGFVIGEPEDVKRLLDPPVVRDGVSERGAVAVSVEHPDDVVGSDRPGMDRPDDPQHAGPVPPDLLEVDAAASRGVERAVVRPAIDTPQALVRDVREPRRVDPPSKRQDSKDGIRVGGGVRDEPTTRSPTR